jgi:hypothetical protein
MMQLVDFLARDHGMACIRATLVTNHYVVVGGQKVDEFPFGFVSPL